MSKRALLRLSTCICFMLCLTVLGYTNVFADEPIGVVKPAHEFLFENDSSSQFKDSGYSYGSYSQSFAGTFKYVDGYNGVGKSAYFNSAYCFIEGDILPIGANSIRFKFKKDASTIRTHYEPIITAANNQEALFYMGIGNYKDSDNGNKIPGNLYIVKREYTKDGLLNFEMESPNSICDGQWHDILFTWDGTTNTNSVKLYIDDMTTPAVQKTATSTDTRKFGKVQLGGSNLLNIGLYYNLTAVIDDLQFYYSAINLNSTNPGDPGNPTDPEDPTTPDPTKLIAIGSDSKVNLSWPKVKDATSYTLKRSTTAGGPYTAIATAITGSTYTDSAVTNGTTYYYVVTVLKDGSESWNSNEASATPTASSDPTQTGKRALLVITMQNGERKEYDLTMEKIKDFMIWYNNKPASSPTYAIEKNYNRASFTSRKDYISYDQITSVEVNEYGN